MRPYTFDMRCSHCGHINIVTLLGLDLLPPIACPTCEVVELSIICVHVGIDADPSDNVNLFHHVNNQRSNESERIEKAHGDAAAGVRSEPA